MVVVFEGSAMRARVNVRNDEDLVELVAKISELADGEYEVYYDDEDGGPVVKVGDKFILAEGNEMSAEELVKWMDIDVVLGDWRKFNDIFGELDAEIDQAEEEINEGWKAIKDACRVQDYECPEDAVYKLSEAASDIKNACVVIEEAVEDALWKLDSYTECNDWLNGYGYEREDMYLCDGWVCAELDDMNAQALYIEILEKAIDVINEELEENEEAKWMLLDKIDALIAA